MAKMIKKDRLSHFSAVEPDLNLAAGTHKEKGGWSLKKKKKEVTNLSDRCIRR